MDEVERQRLSAIAHATSAMWGPISEATIEDVVGRVIALGIGPGSRVVDLGCGPAELLRRIAERTGASGIGIDASPFAIEEAQARLAGSAAADRVKLRLADVRELDREPAFDLVLCIGPGWDAGGWSSLARWTSALVKAGGHAARFRRRPRPPERGISTDRERYASRAPVIDGSCLGGEVLVLHLPCMVEGVEGGVSDEIRQ